MRDGFKQIQDREESRTDVVGILAPELWLDGKRAYYRGVERLSKDAGKASTAQLVSASPDGEIYGIWDCASLRKKLSQVRPGQAIFLQYMGKVDNPNAPAEGAQYMHEWTVAVAEQNDQGGPVRQALTALPDAFGN